ncbi:MAG: geranyl-CoA carboxylase beta subunit [Myxococcales bacterium]|jgi:geranyl-CoA carboxylase beta subunit|nr:geranyl-CoA carboxylase beta subunit [Myxococcales bacterium]
MPGLDSHVDDASPSFADNRDANLRLVQELRSFEARVRANSARMADKFHQRGQLLPRERLAVLLDRGADFVELSTLAGWRMHDDDGEENAAGGGMMTGIGFVSGVRCVVTVSDSAIKGGAIAPMGLRKSLRAQEIALQNKLPMINLVESAGANLNYQAEIFVDGGRVFHNMARLSAAGIPQLTVVHGSSTAGGAYLPGLSDHVIVVRGQAKIFLAGPPLVRAATGEVATDEALGGAELHATVTGSAEYLADDDAHALALAREVMRSLAWADSLAPADASVRPPRYSPDELLGVVPSDYRQPYDVREVIARLVDDSQFLEHGATYGAQTVCGRARVAGFACGIIGNNGPLYPDGATKAAHFIQQCCQSGTPLVFLQNTTGFMVGTEVERAGIIKHGSRLIQAVSNATVPRITVMIGASFGAGNYGMSGRSYDPHFCFSWPQSRIAVMGGEQAGRVLAMLAEEKARRAGKPADPAAVEQLTAQVKEKIDGESRAIYATARLWDDGIIDPRDTRNILAFALGTCAESARRTLRPSSFGVARA